MDFQQPPHGYMRPPPPPPPTGADHHHHLPVAPPQPLPPPNPWYSSQFQYQHQHQHHSPSPPPPPPQQQQWAPPPYHAPHHPYPAHHHHTQYPPPPPQPPLPPAPPPYPQANQDWSNANWSHQQNWGFQAHTNEEDWAAKARAWAAAKSATDHQQPQPQFTPLGRPEEQIQYHDQYGHSTGSHFPDMQKSPIPASSFQHHPAIAAPPQQQPVSHSQEFASFNMVQSSYGNVSGDSAAEYPQHENSSNGSSVHQQEVPSSYSSIAGKGDAGETEKYYMPSVPVSSGPQHYPQPPMPGNARSLSMQEPQYSFTGQSAEPATNLSDQPLNFAPHFNRDYGSHVQTTYSDSGAPVRGVDNNSMPSNYAWATPAGVDVVYPSVPPVLPSASQVDPSMVPPPPVPGHSASMFGRLPGSGFHMSGPSIGAPFSVGAGAVLHPTAAFHGDAFGGTGVAERPKKPSVPNWLREEIIKTKAVITSSTTELPREDNQSTEDDSIDKSYGKSEQADSRSVDSSRSTEEEGDDEDDVETARTAAINQEIKRVLTEVLLKVTDELFDEIATKVLNEDDLPVEEYRSVAAPNNEVMTPTAAAPTAKVEAKVLISAKDKGAGSDNANEKSSSSSPGDLLGLGSYASDDDEDNEIQSSGKSNFKTKLGTGNLSGKHLVENGVLAGGNEESNDKPAGLKTEVGKEKHSIATVVHSDVANRSNDDSRATDPVQGDELHVSRIKSVDEEEEEEEEMLDGMAKKSRDEKVTFKTERPDDYKTLAMNHSDGRETRSRSDKSDRHESKRSSSGKDYIKDEERHKDKVFEKGDETQRRDDEKSMKKERMDDQSGPKDKPKDKSVKSGDKSKDSDSRKRPSPSDVKETKRETGRETKASKEDNGRKKEKIKDEKREKSRHKNGRDSSRNKRRRHSLSDDSRGRDSKESSVFSHADDSNYESSDDSRKKRSSRRHESPSPIRSKRRQLSRSPHSKHSQRRHSPYPSLETKRGKRSRSRSRSPVRRKR